MGGQLVVAAPITKDKGAPGKRRIVSTFPQSLDWLTPGGTRKIMNVRLVSQDGDLYKLCREILSEFPGRDSHLFGPTAENGPSNTDLHIWDFQSNGDLPSEFDQGLSRHLFLVHRKDVARFHERLGRTDTNILLKPLTRATLSAFLGLAVSAHEDRVSTANRLRADRDEILQCLIQTNLKLQEYDQDRTNFLTRAVHDFRAPLTAVSGYSGLLLSEALGPLREDQKEVLRRMQHSTKRLSRMASAMFQLSVGRHVKRHLDLREEDVRECIEQALHELAPIAGGKLISVSVDLDPETPLLYFESNLVVQVLVNLLDNACKFTPKSGEIVIRGYPFFWERRSPHNSTAPVRERRRQESHKPNSYRLDILDSGPLVPEGCMEKIFEEYTSYAGGHDRSGGGLGLAICRMIVTQHEGIVWAENTDNGPVFSFVLPLVPGTGTSDIARSNESFEYSEVRQ
jgi:signal transduction histidine kinase